MLPRRWQQVRARHRPAAALRTRRRHPSAWVTVRREVRATEREWGVQLRPRCLLLLLHHARRQRRSASMQPPIAGARPQSHSSCERGAAVRLAAAMCAASCAEARLSRRENPYEATRPKAASSREASAAEVAGAARGAADGAESSDEAGPGRRRRRGRRGESCEGVRGERGVRELKDGEGEGEARARDANRRRMAAS